MPETPHDFQEDINAVSSIPVISSILEVICRITGMGFAAVARVTEDRWVACSVRDEIHFGLVPGGELKVETTMCHEIRQCGEGIIIDHVELDEQYKFHHTPAMYGFQSYISLPIIRKDGSFFGTLCAIDPKPSKINNPEIIGMFRLFTDLISFHLSSVEQLSFTEALLAEEKKSAQLQKENYEQGQAFNKELTVANEGLNKINEELKESRLLLMDLFDKLQGSELKFKRIIELSPVAMFVTKGEQMLIETVNPPMLSLLGKGHSVVGRPLSEELPEFNDHPFTIQLYNTYRTGEEWVGYELPVSFLRDGELYNGLFNLHFKPFIENGVTTGVLHSIIDVTREVSARKELQRAQDQLHLALQAANIGTWNADLANGKMILSERAKLIHGVATGGEISFEDTFMLVTPQHRERINKAVQWAVETGGSFSEEYIINPFDGSPAKWVRSSGKAYYGEAGIPISVTGTILDITAQKQEEQRKDDFISIASHELKTPVTSLKASLQLMDKMKDNPSSVVFPKLIEQSNRSVQKISVLIDELLNSSRLNDGQLYLNKLEFTISELLNGCCNHVRVAGKHNLIFEGDKNLKVYADEHRIDQVLVNLVNNCVKYAPGSKDIMLGAERNGEMAKISVKDTGPGIPADQIPYLFNRYYRADHAGSQYSGLGLGLYISAEIIKKHGGEIGVDSELGKGSTFWFTLPLN